MTIQLTCKRHFNQTSSKTHLIKCRRTATETNIISHIQIRKHTLYYTLEIKKKTYSKKPTAPQKKQTKNPKDRHHFGQILTHLMQPECWTDVITVQVWDLA